MVGSLKDRVAIVFGGGADGVTNGQATAMTYARAGARIVVVDVATEAADRTVAAITAEGGVATSVTADRKI